jgi:cytochrome c5
MKILDYYLNLRAKGVQLLGLLLLALFFGVSSRVSGQDGIVDSIPGLEPPLPFTPAPSPLALPKAASVTPTNGVSLAWDAIYKEYVAQTNELATHLVFNVTNISNHEVAILRLRPSCGCTVAKMPSTPWRIKPGESGQIDVSTDLRGKRGELNKNVAVETTDGLLWLRFKIVLPKVAGMPGSSGMRGRNLMVALGDRQAVFKGACVRCHVAPAINKTGEDLYDAACGICHDTPQRATMVPALKNRKLEVSREYWDRWIRQGKENTLMPAFEQKAGGPLTEEQIVSLVDYLTKKSAEPPR